MRFIDGSYRSIDQPEFEFPVENGILMAFLPHDGHQEDISVVMEQFYSQNPFPNYDDMETTGSLIEKSLSRGFPEMLNRSIPLHATVLEVGCGTGQLGNFLSIPKRTMISVDITWNSLLLGQKFKAENELQNVSFGQMNLFRLPLRPESFDVVICSGVLHHTNEPYKGFQRLIPLVKTGGHLVIGLYNRFGRFQNRIRAVLAKVFGERVANLDPYLTGMKVEADKRQSWFMDQYRNPHESMHTIDQVLRWFDRNNVEFTRSIPSTVFGSQMTMDYRKSLFDPEPRASYLDRVFSQMQQMLNDQEGGLFIMIGKRS